MGWFERRFDVTEVRRALASDAREFALLWLVFSMLDKLIESELTVPWMIGNAAFGLVMWLSGAYFEFRKESGDA